MLYAIVALLIVIAIVLFLVHVAIGGGILGALAVIVLIWLVLR